MNKGWRVIGGPRRGFCSTLCSRSSVNVQETSHFNALADSWWDPHGPSRLLHLMNPSRIAYLRQQLQGQTKQTKLDCLDVGCGGGILAESLARLPFTGKVHGIDAAKEVINVAVHHARQTPETQKIRYEHISAEQLLSRDGEASWDVITAFEILEHVDRPSDFLTTVDKLLRPGGVLVLSTISRTVSSYLLTIVAAEQLLRLVPRGTHEWRKFVRPQELMQWFAERGGWEGMDARPVRYLPFLGWRMGQANVKGIESNYYLAATKLPNL